MQGLFLTDKGVPLVGKGKLDLFPLLKPGQFNPSPRILLSSDYDKAISRKELIDKFLRGGWLTEKQMNGMKPWIVEMLNDFAIEVLLHAKHGGLDRLLTDVGDVKPRRHKESIPLVIVPQKPTKMKVEVEEIEGDLASEVKVMTLDQIPKETPKPREDDDYDGS